MKTSILFALAVTFTSAPAFADCTYVRCKQAIQAMDLYMAAADSEPAKAVVMVDEAGTQAAIDVEVTSFGKSCTGSYAENLPGAYFTLNRRPVDLSSLYIDGKNVATLVGCQHSKPASL